jgi:orotate phosphoribosyltransferase-like protein
LDCLFSEFDDFVETLPDDARLAIALRRKGLTFDEIGDELNCSNVTARKLVRNARAEFFGGDKAAVGKSIKRA